MSLLKTVQKGRKLKPLALMLHAPHGIGKSTFATEAPDPIYIGQEENDELDVARFPKVESWIDLENQLDTLLKEDHDYKTVVIDTIDGLQQVAEQVILSEKKNEGKTLATAYGGYGKGYEKMANMFLNIRDSYLIPLREKKGMNIVLLAHSEKVKHEDPMTNTSYDHFEVALHKKVKHLFEDWVSAILFANYYLVIAENNSGKEYAEGDGLRMIYTEERPSHVAKNRFDLDFEIEFKKKGTWDVIKKQVLKHFKTAKKKAEAKGEEFNAESDEADKLRADAINLVNQMPKEAQEKIRVAIKRAKDDTKELERIIKKMKGALK